MVGTRPLASLLSAALISAAFCLSGTPAVAAGKVGVMLMHGKGGNCDSSSTCGTLKEALLAKGYLVEAPLMPWGKGRIYDRDFNGAMQEIDSAIAKLKAAGAERVFIAGHSMGGNAGFGYALAHPEIAGFIGIATAHQPENKALQRQGLAEAVARAKAMIDTGKGDEKDDFIDFNVKPQPPAHTTANIYYSWFSEDGPANLIEKAKRYSGMPAVLWLDSETELNPKNTVRLKTSEIIRTKPNVVFEVLPADHIQAPAAAVSRVLAWLQDVPAATAAAPVAVQPAAASDGAAAPASDEPIGPKGNTPSQVIKNNDADGDGKLSKAEFKIPEKAFAKLDADGDGFITRQELIDAWR